MRDDGHLLLPRLIRYIEERRQNESRFTGAIESDPSPLHIVWGMDDPIAVPSMVDTLLAARPDATVVRLEGVGHYPMVEAPALSRRRPRRPARLNGPKGGAGPPGHPDASMRCRSCSMASVNSRAVPVAPRAPRPRARAGHPSC